MAQKFITMKHLILLPVLLAACCPDVPCPDPVICPEPPVCDTTSKDSLQVLLDDVRGKFAGLTARYYVAKDSLFITQVELANVKDQLEDCLLQECPECPPPIVCPDCPCDTTYPSIDTTEPTILYENDFENTSISENNLIGWQGLLDNPLVNQFEFNNLGGIDYASQQIRNDPTGASNKCLYMQVVDDDPSESGSTRAQVSWYLNSGVDLDVWHVSFDIYLSEDIREFEQYPNQITWLTLNELWERRDPSMSGNPAGHARWALELYKDAGVGSPLYWIIKGEYLQPDEVDQDAMWPVQKNKIVPVSFGRWATLDIRYERGSGTDGHVLITLDDQVLFDYHNSTQYYPGTPTPWYAWNVWKLYTADSRLDWMRARGKVLSAYYDNFKWYEK